MVKKDIYVQFEDIIQEITERTKQITLEKKLSVKLSLAKKPLNTIPVVRKKIDTHFKVVEDEARRMMKDIVVLGVGVLDKEGKKVVDEMLDVPVDTSSTYVEVEDKQKFTKNNLELLVNEITKVIVKSNADTVITSDVTPMDVFKAVYPKETTPDDPRMIEVNKQLKMERAEDLFKKWQFAGKPKLSNSTEMKKLKGGGL